MSSAGHTEAGCDLARMAGAAPAAVIVEIMNEDGTMARRPQFELFARQHGIKIGTIADLIRHRLQTERSVERVAEQRVQTEFGEFRLCCYEDHVNRDVHLALVRGEDRDWTLRAALSRISQVPSGVVVLLRQHESPREIYDAVRHPGRTQAAPESAERSGAVLRTFGVGAQILQDLGVRRMRVLSAPKQIHGISAFGLEIVEYVDENG